MLTTQSKGISEAIRSVCGQTSGASARHAGPAAKLQRHSIRFSNLLVSEVELQGNSVEQERKNKDDFGRLTKGFDWGRQTSKKCFADQAAKQVDNFHDELAKLPAGEGLALRRSDDTGASV